MIDLIPATLTGASRMTPNARGRPLHFAAQVNNVVHSVLANRNVGGAEVQIRAGTRGAM